MEKVDTYKFSITVDGKTITIEGEGKPPDIHIEPKADPLRPRWPYTQPWITWEGGQVRPIETPYRVTNGLPAQRVTWDVP